LKAGDTPRVKAKLKKKPTKKAGDTSRSNSEPKLKKGASLSRKKKEGNNYESVVSEDSNSDDDKKEEGLFRGNKTFATFKATLMAKVKPKKSKDSSVVGVKAKKKPSSSKKLMGFNTGLADFFKGDKNKPQRKAVPLDSPSQKGKKALSSTSKASKSKSVDKTKKSKDI
jgi:hypothetical protein